MKKNKTIRAWAVININNKIDIVVHGRTDEVDTYAIMPTKKEAKKCNKLHCYNENEVIKVEIKR